MTSSVAMGLWFIVWFWLILSSASTLREIIFGLGVLFVGSYFVGEVPDGLRACKEKALKRKVALMDNTVCCECGYSLVGYSEEPRCPECGWNYGDIEQVKAAWNAWEPRKAPWWFGPLTSLIERFTRERQDAP